MIKVPLPDQSSPLSLFIFVKLPNLTLPSNLLPPAIIVTSVPMKKLSQWVIILVYLLFHQILSKMGKWGVFWKLIWHAIIYIYTMVTNTITIVLLPKHYKIAKHWDSFLSYCITCLCRRVFTSCPLIRNMVTSIILCGLWPIQIRSELVFQKFLFPKACASLPYMPHFWLLNSGHVCTRPHA